MGGLWHGRSRKHNIIRKHHLKKVDERTAQFNHLCRSPDRKDRIYNITIYVTDTEGNEATAEPQEVEVPTDTKAPIISNISVSPMYAVSGTLIFISAEVTDHLSGVKDVKGIVSKSGEEVSTVPMLDPDEDGIYIGTWRTMIFLGYGIHNINVIATDNGGNDASVKASDVEIAALDMRWSA
jgi:hypothetical protein